MWKSIACYLSGQHEYGISCHNGAIFLQCTHCGRRSVGFEIDLKMRKAAGPGATIKTPGKTARVLPFDQAVAS